MTAPVPTNPLSQWRSSLYRGDVTVVDQFLDQIDRTLPSGWVRDSSYEQTHPHPSPIYCYRFSQGRNATLRLWLLRVKPTRVRGGPIELLRYASSSGGAKRIDSVVSKFAGETLRDAASAVGARSTWPTFGPRSAITAAAEMLFTQFADTADGAWPLTEQQQRMWDELVSGCLAEHVAIDREELGLWLADSGWEQDAVASIVDRFFADSEWLARRLEVAAT